MSRWSRLSVSIGSPFPTAVSLPAATKEIAGKVVNASGKSIRRAVIVLIDTQGRIVGKATAEQDGTFRVSAAAGEFSIKITALGYTPAAVRRGDLG